MVNIETSKESRELDKLTSKRANLIEKKSDCVNNQLILEDNCQEHTAKYYREIEKDFELASKIEDIERLIRNKKAQIKRKLQNKAVK